MGKKVLRVQTGQKGDDLMKLDITTSRLMKDKQDILPQVVKFIGR